MQVDPVKDDIERVDTIPFNLLFEWIPKHSTCCRFPEYYLLDEVVLFSCNSAWKYWSKKKKQVIMIFHVHLLLMDYQIFKLNTFICFIVKAATKVTCEMFKSWKQVKSKLQYSERVNRILIFLLILRIITICWG